jgi:hypothetical protein
MYSGVRGVDMLREALISTSVNIDDPTKMNPNNLHNALKIALEIDGEVELPAMLETYKQRDEGNVHTTKLIAKEKKRYLMTLTCVVQGFVPISHLEHFLII